MRILATLTLIASLASALPVQAEVKANEVQNQNSESKINSEDKNTTWEHNLVASAYTPVFKGGYVQRNKIVYANLPKGDFTLNASAYTAAADECGKSDGITASGAKVQANRTLACPPGYKFGTKIEIDRMGTYVCEDRGGAIK